MDILLLTIVFIVAFIAFVAAFISISTIVLFFVRSYKNAKKNQNDIENTL